MLLHLLETALGRSLQFHGLRHLRDMFGMAAPLDAVPAVVAPDMENSFDAVHSRRGLGSAITLLTFQQALQWGYEWGTLQTTYPNALRLYHRVGFEVDCKIGVYQRPVW